jgi:hypothetical protein
LQHYKVVAVQAGSFARGELGYDTLGAANQLHCSRVVCVSGVVENVVIDSGDFGYVVFRAKTADDLFSE